MATDTVIDNAQPKNPFKSQGDYSPEAVELMRALSEQRQQSGQANSSPAQILAAVADLGYLQPEEKLLPTVPEAKRFLRAMTAFQQEYQLAYPTCEDLLTVLNLLGYHRPDGQTTTIIDGLAIDRRRKEEDERQQRHERRTSLEPSPQELMDLNADEHALLDALKELRLQSEREFASSEELLSIVWNLGYRPTNEDGFPVEWLNDGDRCRTQISFTSLVERRVSQSSDGDFLTCRTLLEILSEIGFSKS
jgi:hypothetical protein